MSTILEDVKTLLEVDGVETIYDDQLMLYINGGMAYLKNNAIPVLPIDSTTTGAGLTDLRDDDYSIVLQWLHFFCILRFDTALTAGGATTNWINDEMTNLLYQLKARYDNEIG